MMMSGKSYKRNLLLAATIVSLSVTMPMNVAYADDPTPTRGANAAYTITNGTVDNHNFTTSDGSTTSYYKTNLSTLNLLNNINGSTVWLEGTQDNNNFSVVLPNNETRYFIYGYTKPDGWGDGERQSYEQNGNAAGNSADYNNRTFNGINSTVSGGAIYINGKQGATPGHGNNLVCTMTADFINNSITNNNPGNNAGLGGALHIWGPYAGIETLNANFIGNYITYTTTTSGGGALAIGEGYNGGELTVGLINGNFINNYVDAPSNNFGGAIYYEGSSYGDGEITSIGQDPVHTTKFVGNHIIGSGQGGAIYAVNKIGSIYADFIGNYIAGKSDSSRGGAISLIGTSDEKNVGSITGDFIGNYITTDANNGTAYGGAIYNSNSVGSITGDFVGNYVVSEQDKTYGGAIYNGNPTNNKGTITNLTGNFIGNYANGKEVYGGAIYNTGTITNLSGKFIENEVYSNAPSGFQTDGGAIANKNNGVIQNITGDFIRNKAHTYDTSRTSMMVSGGAIYNDGAKIGTINANFIENESQKEAGAIYNSGYASSNKGIGTISGNFIKNKVTGEIARDTYGGAISNTGTIDSITNASFTNNTVNSANGKSSYGGAIYNDGVIAIDNGYGYYFDGGIVDSSFINNSATTNDGNSYGGAIYNSENAEKLMIKADTKDVNFIGNSAQNGASIYNKSVGGTYISATGGDVTFTNNTPTSSNGYGIYSQSRLDLSAAAGRTIKIDDNINIVNDFAELVINSGNSDSGTIQLNGNIKFNGSNSGIDVGNGFGMSDNFGTLKLGQTPANLTYNYIKNSGNYTLDLQNEHAGDNMTISSLQGVGEMKLNVDYDATANAIDKLTVNAGSGIITLNAVNVMNDNADFVNGTTAEYLDGAARGNITVISDAINSATDTGWLYVFTPTSTNGELSIARTIAYEGDLINAIQDDLGGTYHPTSFSLSDNFTADRNFGALSTENREQFTIFGNNHTISGDNNAYTGIEVASGQTLNLDNVRFSNVKTYDVQNAGTLNLSGTNTINTIAGATGNTNITGGTTTIANNGSVVQNAINLKGGHLNLDAATVNANIVADGTGESSGSLRIGDGVTLNGTISGTFKNNPVNNPAIYFRNLSNADIDDLSLNSVNFDSNKDGAIRFISNGDLTLTNNQFTNNERSVNSIIGNDASGAVTFLSSGTNSITGSTFTGNKTKADTVLGGNAYGGAIYQQGGTLTISGATFDGNSVEGSSGGSGGAIYSNGTNLTITGTAENPTVFKNNGISKYENSTGSASGGAIYQKNGTLNISNTKFENNVSSFNTKQYLYGGAIYSEATGGNISADFTGNTLSAAAVQGAGNGGGAIYNEGTLTKITGDFTNNAITLQPTSNNEQNGESLGGALYNRGTITNGIDGTFSGNTITTNVKQSDANGGALANTGTIGNITGDFLNNYVTSTNTTYSGSARGGAIYNLSGTIGNITATNATENGFKGNSATKAAGWNAEGLGGAIYNYNGTIGNITANFVNNTATNYGGAIYNIAEDNYKSEIGNIIGNFTGNTASQGSAIYNKVKNNESYINNKLAKIGDITGNFTENVGTVIYNEGYYDFNNFNEIVYAQIGDITGNFAENSASSGNVIFNNYGKIGDITGDFTENTTNNGVINNRGSIDSITANTTAQKGFYKNTGGAVRNESSADYHRNATIGNITADFKENSAVSSGGGAIYNTGSNASAKAKIGDITGDFDKNTSKNYGAAIYNNYSIIGAQNNLGEFTGTAITGDFTYNQVDNNSVYNPIGGAIANENSSSIGNIQGNFENNSIIDSRYKAMGGAIANRNSSTIGNIISNFNTNTISYNPSFDTDTTQAQNYGNSSLGGAIYNDSTSTIGTLTGDFNGNWVKGHVAENDTTTVFAAAGGAIYNEGALGTITGDIKNNYALGHSHHGVYGGAIYTTTGLNLVDSDITGNYVTTQSASATDLKGGAIYTTDGINITASTKNISVSGNKGTEQGAAIYNTSENNAVVLNATGGNITFENNNLTGLANGGGVGIYSAGGLTLNAADGKYIAINDALNIAGNTTLNGTLKLGDNAVETLANTTSKFIAQGGALDIANGAIDTMTFANVVDIQNAINLGLDVNLTGTTATADKVTADFTTGNTSAIALSALNFINDNYTGSEEEHELTIASGTIKSLINETVNPTVTGNTNTYTYSYNQGTGILTLSLVTYDNIHEAVADSTKPTRTYKIKTAGGEYVQHAIGAIAGANSKLTINGDNKYLDGTVESVKQGGFIVANGQTLELKNISQVKNFTTAVDNAGTLNVENVTFTNNSTADINNTGTANIINSDVAKIVNSSTVNVTDSTIRNIKNTGVLNISDTDGTPVYMLLITDNETPEGITNITGGYTQFVGNVTQNTINLKGGNLTLPNNTTVNANIVADGTVDKTGYLNNFSSGSTINGTISGTFKGNDEVALSNVGTIGNVTSNFVNNTHSGSSDIMGGAIYNTGTMGTISGNFTGNSATSSSGNAYGGAIYQNGGTLTISGSTFGGSETGQGNSATSSASGKYGYGGAIYLTNATATITDSNFEKNSAMWGGAIYQNSGSLTLNNATFKNNTGNIGSSIYQKSGTLSITGSTFDNTNSGNLWQESGNLSITGSNFTNTDVTSRLGSNVTITGSTFDNSPVHFLGKGNETSASYQNTFSIVNSTIQNVTASHSNAYALSVCGGDVTIDGVNIINNTNARGIKSEAAAQSAGDYTHYSKLNIIAQTADVNITGNKEGVHVIGWNNDDHYHTTLSLYAKNHDILISGNTDRGLSYYDQYGSLTLNADTGHNITINDSVSSNVGMTVNSDNNAGTVALNGALTLGSALNVNGGTLTLNDTAASSMANKDLVLNGGALKLDSVAAAAIVNTNLGLNGGKFDIANDAIDNLTFTNAINNAVNSYIALDVSLGDTNTADKITSDISGASTINVSDINFISDNKNGGEVQIAEGNIKSVITVSDVAGGYADVQYNNSTGVLSFADKIDWLKQTNGANSGYRFTKTNNGIMPVNYTSGENNYTFYTDILRKNYVDNNSVAHDLKYTWNNATHTLSVTNSDDTAIAQTTMAVTGAGSTADPYILKGDYTGNNSALGFERWDRVGSITGDFIGNTSGGIGLGMGITIGDIKGNFIGNTGNHAFSLSGDHSWNTNISSITGDFIGNYNNSTGWNNSGGAVYIMNWNNGGIGTVTGDFIGNKADGDAGAIWLADGYINSLTGNFINNYAGVDAGALLVGGGHNGANITVIGDFIGNQAVDQGGAIYNWSGATTRLIDSSFIGNIASEGAAIYIDNGELSVTALNKDIEFTNNNSTGTAGGDGYGIYHKSSGYRPFAINAYEGRTITVNDKVYSEQKINLNCYYSGDWVGKNGTIIFNNEFTQTGATEISSNESNAGGGTVIFNGATTLGSLDVSGTATLKLGAGAGTSTFGAVTFSRSPILDIANDSAQTLTVASIKNNAKLNIDLDFTGDSVLGDAINISTGGKTGVLTINDINAITSDTGVIREFTNLAILTGETDGITLALSEAIQQDPRFNGAAVENLTWESDYTDVATFENTVFTSTEYSETKQKHLYVVDGTKLSFDETTTIPKHATGNVTTQDVLQALNQSTSAARSLTTDDADATYTVGDNIGATGTGSLSVTGTTSGSDASTLNMNGKSGFELSNSDTTLALSNLNITGIKDVDGGLINITGENSSATLTSVTVGSTTNSAIVNNRTLTLAGNTTINTGIKGTGAINTNGTVALNGALTLSGTTNVTGGTLKLGTSAADSTFKTVAFTNTPTLDLQNTTANTMVVDKIIGDATLNIDVNSATSVSDSIQISTTGSLGTLTVNSLSFLDDVTTPESFNINVITKGSEGDISGITLAISDALAEEYSGTPTVTDYDKPYTYNSNITFDTTKFTTEKWTKTTQKQLTVTSSETAKGLKLNVNEISDVHKQDGEGHYIYDTNYDALQVLNQHEGSRTLKADGATANAYTVDDNLGTTATGTLNVTGKSSGSNLDMNNKTGFVVSNADTTLNLSNLNITNVSDTADGGLVTVSGTGSKANLENVTIASTTNSAISNAVELNLSGSNNLGTGIVGAAGTTNITGGKTTVGSITQNVVNITAGELEVANITTTDGISNDGTLTLTGTANSNAISGTGHTVIAGNVNNTGAINQAITVNGTKTLTTAANLIGGAVTNSGTVELTGGALGQTITGGDITIASGEVTSTVANLGGDITNDATLNLSGTLDKNIAGTEGITKLADNMTFADGAGVSGTLNFNGKAITMSGDDATSTFNIGKINSDGTINIDVNTSGSPVSDVINITTAGSTGTITINSINEIGARGDDFTLNVLQGTTGSLQLALSDAVHSQFDQAAQDNLYYVSDAYDATIDFDKTSFDTVEWDRVTQKAISIEDNTKIKYSTNVISDTPTGNVTQKDALAFINQNTDTSAVADRSMVTSDTNKTYTVQEDLGTTGAGTLLVQGASDKTTKLDMNNHSGFVVANSGTAVTLKDINVDNVQNTDGGLVNITNTGSSATLDGAVVNVKDNPENKANVISSNGTLGVTNSTVNAGVNNNGTMNLNGTNQIASVEGSNGTANVQAGTTTVGSIFQKLINIVTGGKLASNSDVTATNGITNDTANGLSVANGTLTGNVTGSGSTDFKGTSAIADGSTVGQAITVVDGKLTTLADGLGGAVTNGGEVDLTGGTLETSITGGNTTISGNVGVDDTLGSIASAVKVETDAKLTTNADKVTGAINNGGNLDLTGGDIKNTISGGGTTTITGDVTNTTGQTVTQQDVEIASGASLTSDADKVTADITNAGTYTMTGGDNANDITGAGSTVIDGDVTNTGDIQNAITVNSGKSFESDADNIQNTVNNNGTYTVTGGDIQSAITGATGTTIIAGDVTNTTGQTVTQQDVEIASGASLTSDADKVTADITNAGTYTMTGGDNANDITGAGSTVIDGDVTNTGDIQNAITVNSGKSFESDADNIQNTVNNNGTYTVTGGDIKNTISGDGTTTISGTVTNSTGSTIGNAVTVAATGDLTTAADKLDGAVANGGTVQLDGGTLGQTITGGNISIIDDVDTNASNLAGATTVASSKELTLTGGDVNSNISGAGDTKIAGSVNNNANISTATEVAGGALDNTNGQLADVTVTSGSLKSNADNVGVVANNGTYEITGGTIASGNGISGTGDINITGNVINNAINTTTGAVTVAENAELAIGTTGNAFSNASSVTLDNGSTLNMQNGTASNTVMDNLVIADGDTVNLKMDWNDTINSASTNIGGNLSVTDINMSTTTGDDEYVMTTTLDDKVSVAENVNLSGVTESTSNFVNYNPATGELISYKNSLVKAVDKTDTGMSATYVMTGDETAGGGELDGTLKVQGNGHSITTGGVVIGSTTIQNAELTLEDANMRNITGDAITVYGGNKGHIVANAHDVAITANTGNAIKLIANGTNYAEMDIDAGSKTVTIDNDIVSDDSNNKVTFKGGTINFKGKFDPAMGVVGGATVNRGGDDDGIDWTVTSGTLNYLQDSYLNRATNTMNLNGGTLNTVNGVVTDFALGGFTLSNDSNFYADVDLAAGKMDNFLSTPTTYTGGTLHVAGLNLISDATTDNTSIPFANSTLAGHVDYTGAQGLTALSPIYKYNVGYNSSNGNFDFARYNSGGYDGLNPAIMAAPVAAQMGGYLTQLNSYDEAFRNMDMYMLMTASQRQALKNKNKIASLDGGILYDQTLMRQERAEGWFRPFATFEKVPLKNGPKVENIAYGTYMGGESEMYDLSHGWDGMWGVYVGYNGSHQNYDGVSIYQNGGTLGVLGMAYKGNFFTGLTINAGASGVEASTMYGNEDFAMLMAGIASKTGYNWELFNGKFIIQPSMLMSYSFVNTFDYRNAAGVKVDSDPLHAIQLQPELKFIGNLKNGWQPYASVAMVWNIMDDTKFKANDVSLPELSVKPYVKYGVGVRKTWGERLTGFFQTYLTNGGRNGVGLQAGFTWAFGGGKDKKADEKKIQKSLNKTPELKKTEIVLNGKKVQ